MPIRPWSERTFVYTRPLADVTVLIARVNGTSARLEDSIRGIEERIVKSRTPSVATTENLRPPLRWSPLDHAGHLLDVDELHSQRIKDFLNDKETLSPADPGNSKTEEEHYNRQPVDPILQRFRVGRSTMTNVLFGLPESAFEKRSKHPRTSEPIRLLDYVELIAEHDDHHLATIRELIWNPAFSQ
jgi:DinB superfamily